MLVLGGFRVVLGHFARRLTEHSGDGRRIASRFPERRFECVPRPMKTLLARHEPDRNGIFPAQVLAPPGL
jgi:hypothetical protein